MHNSSEAADTIPKHLGLILDGNRRWAVENGLPKMKGHQQGYENLKKIVQTAFDRGVEVVSAYIFSTENWNRAEEEVSYLMDLAYKIATSEVKELHKNNIRVRFLGQRQRLQPRMIEAIDRAEEQTKDNTRGTVALCFNYGGQHEIVDAANAALQPDRQGELTIEDVDRHLYAADIPPLDLIIRTSGEQRLSNFMLWRAAYAELYFTDVHWPAFGDEDLDSALADYASRQRRFGA